MSPGRWRGGWVTAAMGLLIAGAVGPIGSVHGQEPPAAPPVHDAANAAHEKLQKPAEAYAGLPLDKRGRVDWMKALRAGQLKPRADLEGKKPIDVLDLDVIMKNTAEMPHVKFPHESHTLWLACSNCHDKIFVPKAGANAINMTKIFQGEYCGVCHDRVAFTTMFACERCHSVLQPGAKAWW